MKKLIAKKWATALRSGNYKQCFGKLRQNDRFCPLGILCDISKMGSWEFDLYGDSLNYTGLELPARVAAWAGMNSLDGRLPFNQSLARFNDIDRLDFEQIAQLIEENYEEL